MKNYKPLAFWASVSYKDDTIAQKVKSVNAGCESDKEVIRPSTIKEHGVLTVEDFKAFNAWLLEQQRPSYRAVVQQLNELRQWRWATWHIMGSDNPKVSSECSMLGCGWLCPFSFTLDCLFWNEFCNAMDSWPLGNGFSGECGLAPSRR